VELVVSGPGSADVLLLDADGVGSARLTEVELFFGVVTAGPEPIGGQGEGGVKPGGNIVVVVGGSGGVVVVGDGGGTIVAVGLDIFQ
jgi:hypothetical protein